MSAIRWTDDALQQLLAELASGLTPADLGPKYGVTPARISQKKAAAERKFGARPPQPRRLPVPAGAVSTVLAPGAPWPFRTQAHQEECHGHV